MILYLLNFLHDVGEPNLNNNKQQIRTSMRSSLLVAVGVIILVLISGYLPICFIKY